MRCVSQIKRHSMAHTVIVMVISIMACSLIFPQNSRSTAGPLSIDKSIQDGASNNNRSEPPRPIPAAGVAVEQRSPGTRSSAQLVESFDGLGFGFEGPQGKANLRNPSDNTIAVGPDHIVQIVNSRRQYLRRKVNGLIQRGRSCMAPL